MPKYEYLCKVCGHSFEVNQSFTDDPLTVCDVCGGELRKVFGSIGITFKGSGFYRNDSKATATSTRSSTSSSVSESNGNGSASQPSADSTAASSTPAAEPKSAPAPSAAPVAGS